MNIVYFILWIALLAANFYIEATCNRVVWAIGTDYETSSPLTLFLSANSIRDRDRIQRIGWERAGRGEEEEEELNWGWKLELCQPKRRVKNIEHDMTHDPIIHMQFLRFMPSLTLNYVLPMNKPLLDILQSFHFFVAPLNDRRRVNALWIMVDRVGVFFGNIIWNREWIKCGIR